MSLDAQTTALYKLGRVVIDASAGADGRPAITIDGFEGTNSSCRDVAALAMTWAIGELQRDLQHTLEAPGRGRAVIGEEEGNAPRTFPRIELNRHTIAILGRPNFMCASIADALRATGMDIARKAEHEQAAAIQFLLGMYAQYGDDWEAQAQQYLVRSLNKKKDGAA